jgi:hypothetical protein
VIARTFPRGKAPDVIRVLAVKDGTKITTVPAMTIPTLNTGSFHEFEITDHIELTANEPFMVGHYLEGQNAPFADHAGCYNQFTGDLCEVSPSNCICDDGLGMTTCTRQANCSPDDANIGDPSQIMGVPVEQFRGEYVFLVPIKYRNNYISIVAPVDATVTLDGNVMAANVFQTLPGGGYKVSRMPMSAGSHTLSADKRVGLEVYGWDFYVSYGYPGGMNIETLSIF